MSQRDIFAIVLPLVLFLTGCTSQDSETYFPLSDGARWEYSVEILAPGRNTMNGKMMTRVDGKETINGKRYFKVVEVISGIPGAEPEINYYRTTPKGIYFVSQKHIDHPEQLYLPASLDVGSSWSVRTPDSDTRYTVEGIEDAELFDRKYANSLKIAFEVTEETEDAVTMTISGVSHYAPSVGAVRTTMTMQNRWGSKIQMSITLEKHEK